MPRHNPPKQPGVAARFIPRDRALNLAENARVVLERRYLAKDDAGTPIETPEQLFRRVADNIAQAEALYGQHATGNKQQGAVAGSSSRRRPALSSADGEEAPNAGSPSPRRERGLGGEEAVPRGWEARIA
jgi:ribonucleotide reductase alpha subunit